MHHDFLHDQCGWQKERLMSFFRMLENAVAEKDSLLCIGLDPSFSEQRIRELGVEKCAEEALAHNLRLIEATAPYAAAYKPNSAFYEALGEPGMQALHATIAAIPDTTPVILDAKRGDISSTGAAYAQAVFGRIGADAVTLSPYMGIDTLDPFLSWEGKGVFLLCRTSNPGAGFLQDLQVDGEPLYVHLARNCATLPSEVGLVVAGNDLEALRRVRQVNSHAWFLSPGIGVQGGRADEAFIAGARKDGSGILVVAARAVAEADDPAAAARALRDAIRAARDRAAAHTTEAMPSDSRHEALKAELAKALLATGCFRLGEFVLKSGKKSPFYIDLRRLVSDPHALRTAAKAYASLARSLEFDRIAGIPAAGLPLATAVSLEIGVPMIWPRMPVKEHGTGNRIEGDYHQRERVLLLDDLITTGASKLEAIEILKAAALDVQDLVVLIERGRQGRVDMEQAGVRLHAFIHVKELFLIFEREGLIDAATRLSLERFVDEE